VVVSGFGDARDRFISNKYLPLRYAESDVNPAIRRDSAPTARTRLAVAIIGWALLSLFALLTTWQGGIGPNVRHFQLAYAAGFVGFVLLIIAARRSSGAGWHVFAWTAGVVAIRLVMAPTAPSDDAYRYLWEGRIQRAGFNPYAHSPDDPVLAHLRDEHWHRLNHPDYPAIYGPVAQCVFLMTASVHASPAAIKAVVILCEVLAIILLAVTLRNQRDAPRRIVLYSLCPLTLTAFAVEGHIDAVMLMFIALAFREWTLQRWALAGAAIGLAMGVKLVAAVLLPWLLIRRPRVALVALAVLCVCYLPYISAGPAVLSSLVRFSSGNEFFSFLSAIGLPEARSGVAFLVVAALYFALLGYLVHKENSWLVFSARAIGVTILFAPIVHYWYVTWILFMISLCSSPSPDSASSRVLAILQSKHAWLAFAVCAVLYFEAERNRLTFGMWVMPPWAPMVCWSAFLIAGFLSGSRAPRT
jgi:hypothetical protein